MAKLETAAPAAGNTFKRFWILPLMFFFVLFAFFDRINVSILATNKGFLAHYGLAGHPASIGLLLTSFVLAYALSNFVISVLTDHLGARNSITILGVIWSLVMLLMTFTASFAQLLWCRVILGVAEGPQFAINSKWVRAWFLPKEQSRVNAAWLFGSPLGSALGLPLVTLLVYGISWQAGFWALAILSFLPLPLVFWFVRDNPKDAKWLPKPELQEIQEATGGDDDVDHRFHWSGVAQLLTNRDWWHSTLANVFMLAILWGISLWLPSYLLNGRHMTVSQMGINSGLSFFIEAIGLVVGALVADRWMRRAPVFTGGLALMAVSLFFATITASNTLFLILLWCATFGFGVAIPPYHTVAQNIPPKHLVGTGYGLWNGVGNLFSAFVPAIMGAIIGATHSYSIGMWVIVLAAALGAIDYAFLIPRRF